MRSAVNEIRKARLAGMEPRLGRFADVPEEYRQFLDWARTLSATALSHDIVALRNAFQGNRAIMEAIRDAVAAPSPADRRAEHYCALVERIHGDDRISADRLAAFLKTHLEDPERAALLQAHPRFLAMMERAGLSDQGMPSII